MSNNNLIFNISSEHCLKSLFSYLEYDYILRLLKYNKRLQNKLEIEYNYLKSKYIIKKVKKIRKIRNDFLSNVIGLYFIGFLLSILIIFTLIFGTVLIKRRAFDDDNTKDLIRNWKSKPIYEIILSDESKESTPIGKFKGIKKKIKNQLLYFWEGKTFKLSYKEKLNYKNIHDPKEKQCGYDNKKHKLFFPNKIECPINYIEITNNEKPSMDDLSFTTLKINNLKYLHYTNQYIEGEILINFQIGIDNGICEYKNYDSLSNLFKNYNIKKKGCKNDLYDNSYTIIDKIPINQFLTENHLEEAKNYLSSDFSYIYFYKRTYKGYETSNQKNINFILKNINVIKKIHLSLCGFIIYIIVSYFILLSILYKPCSRDSLKKRIITEIILILEIGLYLIYNIVIIWKLHLSYRMKNTLKNISKPLNEIYNKKGILWFMRCDYFLIIYTFIFITCSIFSLIFYYSEAGTSITQINEIVLTEFKNIKIKEHLLPKSFLSMNEKSKKNYLLNHFNEFLFFHSEQQIQLIDSINKFRIENNVGKLKYNEYENIPDFIVKEPSEMKLFKYKHIFKISNKKYLFKYPNGEFQKEFNQRNSEILKILLLEDLNKILIIKNGNYEYIFIYQDNLTKNRRLESSKSLHSEWFYFKYKILKSIEI